MKRTARRTAAIEPPVAEGQKSSVDDSVNDGQLMTQEDVAKWLQCSERALEQWRNSRQGPKYRKIGSMVRYVRKEVQDWIDSNSVETNCGAI